MPELGAIGNYWHTQILENIGEQLAQYRKLHVIRQPTCCTVGSSTFSRTTYMASLVCQVLSWRCHKTTWAFQLKKMDKIPAFVMYFPILFELPTFPEEWAEGGSRRMGRGHCTPWEFRFKIFSQNYFLFVLSSLHSSIISSEALVLQKQFVIIWSFLGSLNV